MSNRNEVDKHNRTTIKLNGQNYNALSGQAIGAAPKSRTIDGIVKPVSAQTAQKIYSNSAKKTTVKAHRAKTRSTHQVSRSPAPAQTLMRHAVQKPAKSVRLINNISSPLSISQRSSDIVASPMIGSVDKSLARRASSIKLSSQISHFGAYVREASSDSPYLKQSHPIQKPPTPIVHPKKPDMFEAAIERATSHEQPPLTKKQLKQLNGRKPKHKKAAAYTAAVLVAAGGLGFLGYANLSNVMVKVASLRAGFSASLPSYRPSGYSLASVGYQPGVVAFNFNGDGKSFSITERASDWDSETLASSLIVPAYGSYKTTAVGGQTIYVYGKDQAAWVTNGILYQVKGNGSLTNAQLLMLAKAL